MTIVRSQSRRHAQAHIHQVPIPVSSGCDQQSDVPPLAYRSHRYTSLICAALAPEEKRIKLDQGVSSWLLLAAAAAADDSALERNQFDTPRQVKQSRLIKVMD